MIRDSNRARITYPTVRKEIREVVSTSAATTRAAMNTSLCERSTDTALFYAPWGSQAESTAGAIDEEAVWIPPFGANTTISSVFIYTQTAAGSTTVTIRDTSENILATATVNMASAQTIYEFELDYAISTNQPLLIGVAPTTAVNTVRLSVLSQETVAGASYDGAGSIVTSFSYCGLSSTALFYLPWGNFAEAIALGVDEEVVWMPPFGTSTKINSVLLYCQGAGGSTTVTIRDTSENILATSTVDMASAQTIYEFEFEHQLAANEGIIVGVQVTSNIIEIKALIVAEQVG